MRLLLLGGTVFVGRHLVAAARARGHEVTLFNRGRTAPDLFPDVAQLRGDRHGDLSALEGPRWDAVIDTSGYLPRVVRASAEALADAVEHYTFVSTVSVYRSFRGKLDERSPLAELSDPATEDVSAHYGALKAGCEDVVRATYTDGAFIVRPGLICGPHDPTGRFTYWPMRIAQEGDVLAPGRPNDRIQLIDARDLAEWVVGMVERRAVGTYNVAGPEPRSTIGELLETCRVVAGSDSRLVWVDSEFLLEHGVGEWEELPLWIADPAWSGLMNVDCSAAIAAGLRFRPLADTVRGTLAWSADAATVRPEKHGPPVPEAGLSRAREAELLALWRERGSG